MLPSAPSLNQGDMMNAIGGNTRNMLDQPHRESRDQKRTKKHDSDRQKSKNSRFLKPSFDCPKERKHGVNRGHSKGGHRKTTYLKVLKKNKQEKKREFMYLRYAEVGVEEWLEARKKKFPSQSNLERKIETMTGPKNKVNVNAEPPSQELDMSSLRAALPSPQLPNPFAVSFPFLSSSPNVAQASFIYIEDQAPTPQDKYINIEDSVAVLSARLHSSFMS